MLDPQNCADILDVVKAYVEGMFQNDPDKLRHAMHQKCCIIGHYGGGLEWDTRDAFIATVKAAVKTPDLSPWYAITSITCAGDVATVQLEDIWLGEHYDDSLTLLHHENRWTIVSKVFFLRPAK